MATASAYKPRIIGPGQVLYASDSEFPIFTEDRKYLAQGDSWFSIGAFPPFMTTNVLMEMQFPSSACIVNCAHPGDTLAHMVNWRQDPQFVALVVGRTAYRWDGILLSAGGNDLIDAAQTLPHDTEGRLVPPDQRIFLTEAEWPATGGDERYLSEPGWATFDEHLKSQFDALMALLARPDSENRNVTVHIHLYDYPTARDSPAATFPFQFGPWLYKALTTYNIPDAAWAGLVHILIDRLAVLIQEVAQKHPLISVANTRGLLDPAEPNAHEESGDWLNEIHPKMDGYKKIARVFSATVAPVLPVTTLIGAEVSTTSAAVVAPT